MDIAFVYAANDGGDSLAHPVHEAWGERADADFIELQKTSLPGPLTDSVLGNLPLTRLPDFSPPYDVYIFESPGSLFALPRICARDPNAATVFLHTTWRLSGRHAHNWADWPPILRLAGAADRTLDMYALRWLLSTYIDGVLTVSELFKDRLQTTIDVPVEIVHPYISAELAADLQETTPTLTTNRAVTVGAARGHKGTDLLVDAWPTVRDAIPDAELHIIGRGHPDSYETTAGVTVRGFVESLPQTFSTASLAVHPARIDAFPVSTLETMRAGLPTIVTTTTGTKSRVERVSPELVTDPDPASLAETIRRYFERSTADRRTLSQSARTAVSDLHETEQEGAFETALTNLVARLDGA